MLFAGVSQRRMYMCVNFACEILGCKVGTSLYACAYVCAKWLRQRCVCVSVCDVKPRQALLWSKFRLLSVGGSLLADGNYLRLSSWDTSQIPSGNCGKVHLVSHCCTSLILNCSRKVDSGCFWFCTGKTAFKALKQFMNCSCFCSAESQI